jgi:hypothetical protein
MEKKKGQFTRRGFIKAAAGSGVLLVGSNAYVVFKLLKPFD